MKASQSYSIKMCLQFLVARITRLIKAYDDAKCVGVGALTYLAVVQEYMIVEVDNAIKRGNFQDWVDGLLQITFFYKCLIHDLQEGELNRYCIT
ncbi:hypothetical protein ACS0TY_016286 [Phlomoides rotata]